MLWFLSLNLVPVLLHAILSCWGWWCKIILLSFWSISITTVLSGFISRSVKCGKKLWKTHNWPAKLWRYKAVEVQNHLYNLRWSTNRCTILNPLFSTSDEGHSFILESFSLLWFMLSWFNGCICQQIFYSTARGQQFSKLSEVSKCTNLPLGLLNAL